MKGVGDPIGCIDDGYTMIYMIKIKSKYQLHSY